MNKKQNLVSKGNKVDPAFVDYREFAESFRAAATVMRHALNISLNVPITSVLPTKEDFDKFLSSIDYLQGKFFEYYKAYNECAITMEKNSKETASAVAN